MVSNEVSLENYYGKLKIIWEDLANQESKFVCGGCTCRGCICDFVRKSEKTRENEKLHQFYLGFGVSIYGNVRSAIVNMEPLPSIFNGAARRADKEFRSKQRESW